MSLMAGGETCK